MSRFKFRAWHEGEKVMIPNEDQGFEGGAFKWLHEGQPVEIMQYTGHTDQNDNEICEGDLVRVVRHNGEFDETVPIVFERGAFRLLDLFMHTDVLGQFGSSCLEIVGNIYENSELAE